MAETPPDALSALVTEWGERRPDEVRVNHLGHADLYHDGILLGILGLHALDDVGLWLIEGHARACIERAGYDIEMGAQGRFAALAGDGRPHYYAVVAGRVSLRGDGPTLAEALIRLRLALPAPTPDA